MPNRLAKSTSPYLLQHQFNPVEWYPWGKEALAKSRRQNKPIMLSVGYSSCHWCHVMAHESFEDQETADYLNQHFVSIKVDREERPDIDHIYMATVQAMTGHGGWPLTAFLTPDGVPFYGGTYWPKEERQGMPAFARVLEAVAEAWEQKPEDVEENAERMRGFLQAMTVQAPTRSSVATATTDSALEGLVRQFDSRYGGFGGAPKFPQPAIFEFLLRAWKRRGDEGIEQMLRQSFDGMANGGIYDQIGGGFHRYAVDAKWLVPHFEKMLYDNAQLAMVYLNAWRAFGDDSYRQVVEQTLDWILREMTGERGQFYSAQDADTEGEEGRYYTWTMADLGQALTPDQAAMVAALFGVSEDGNFEGTNVLSRVMSAAQVAEQFKIEPARAELAIAESIALMHEKRLSRERPGVDNKALANWNAMATVALAEAGTTFGRKEFVAAAVRNGKFLLGAMRPRGEFRHAWQGKAGSTPAFLDDYAWTALACLSLYRATFDINWLDRAVEMTREMQSLFGHDSGVGFYDSSDRHEALVARPRDLQDGATPSGNALAAEVMFDIAARTDDQELMRTALDILEMMARPMAEQPLGYGMFLAATERYLANPKELAIAGLRKSNATRELATVVWQRYEPALLLGLSDPESDLHQYPSLQDKPMRNGATVAYLCEQHACMPPVDTAAALAKLLETGTGVIWREF